MREELERIEHEAGGADLENADGRWFIILAILALTDSVDRLAEKLTRDDR